MIRKVSLNCQKKLSRIYIFLKCSDFSEENTMMSATFDDHLPDNVENDEYLSKLIRNGPLEGYCVTHHL